MFWEGVIGVFGVVKDSVVLVENMVREMSDRREGLGWVDW